MLVPVGLVNAEGRGLANSVSALFVRVPVGIEDPVTVLKTVSAEVGRDKRRHQALAAGTALRLLEPLPQNLLAAAAGLVQHQPFFNLVVTNVPGPPVPLYALGARLSKPFPSCRIGNQSLAVAALSYEGQLGLGVLSDPATCPAWRSFGRCSFRPGCAERKIPGTELVTAWRRCVRFWATPVRPSSQMGTTELLS